MSDDVYILGVGMTKFGKYLDKSIKTLTGEALELVLSDCDLGRDDVEAAWFSNSYWGMYTMQHGIRGQVTPAEGEARPCTEPGRRSRRGSTTAFSPSAPRRSTTRIAAR
jgi:acetyl-CoA acetyltransferase